MGVADADADDVLDVAAAAPAPVCGAIPKLCAASISSCPKGDGT